MVLTPAGATHPYGKDPDDRTIRIAPSFPVLEEVAQAAEGVAICVLLATAEKARTQSALGAQFEFVKAPPFIERDRRHPTEEE